MEKNFKKHYESWNSGKTVSNDNNLTVHTRTHRCENFTNVQSLIERDKTFTQSIVCHNKNKHNENYEKCF